MTFCRLLLVLWLAIMLPCITAWTTIQPQSTALLHSTLKPTAEIVFPTVSMDSLVPVAASTSSSSSSLELSAVTLDPTTFLTGIFGAFLNTPIILAVPIVAALAVAGLLAYLLVQSSVPYEDDE